jgi:hypothetical protein
LNFNVQKNGRFIAYANGTVLDTKTNLMWASKDSVKNISLTNIRGYIQEVRVGGYNDWCLPTMEELKMIYARDKENDHESNESHE